MATRIVFEDAGDTFKVTDEGQLEVANPALDDDPRTLILPGGLEAFIAWLTDEADKLKAREAEAKSNG